MNTGGVKIEIRADKANLEQFRGMVARQTGDEDPFFCPRVINGQPYEGHAHVSLPAGASEPDLTPIELR